MDLLDYLGPGKRGEEIAVDVTSLAEGDLRRLPEARPDERQPLSRIRNKHHALARALANGLSDTEAGIVSGFGRPTISVLKNDPTFQELLRFYEGEAAKTFDHMAEALFGLSMDALKELQEKVEAGDLPASQLIEIAKLGADRTGHGPSSKTEVNINVGLADRMAAAQKRLEAVNRAGEMSSPVGRTAAFPIADESRVAGTAKFADVTYEVK